MRGRERRGGREEEGREKKGEGGKGREWQWRGGKARGGQWRGGKGRERTTLRTTCRKFLTTSAIDAGFLFLLTALLPSGTRSAHYTGNYVYKFLI